MGPGVKKVVCKGSGASKGARAVQPRPGHTAGQGAHEKELLASAFEMAGRTRTVACIVADCAFCNFVRLESVHVARGDLRAGRCE